jgi:integrase
MRTRVRCIEPADRKRVLTTFGKARTLYELRTRALVLLAWGAGLRLKEVCALNLTQVLEDPKAKTLGRIRSQAYLQPRQSKGRRRGNRAPWDSAGAFVITKPARVALRQYLRAAQRVGWVAFPPADNAPVFLASGKGKAGGKTHRISRRSAQHAWTELQKAARIAHGYRFHDLRHDALTRFAEAASGDVFRVARFGRCDPYTALHYVHSSPTALIEIAERAALRKAS